MELAKGIVRGWRRWLDCTLKRCDYYTHYLAYGPATLTHVGYHSAEKLARQHMDNCAVSQVRVCATCTKWEERLRA